MNPWEVEAKTISQAESHFQTYKGQEGSREWSAWICEGEILKQSDSHLQEDICFSG